MARGYPRFLFSDPKNTKGSGPFIVHLLQPRLVFKVVQEDNHIQCIPLDKHTDAQTESLIRREAETWLHYQIKDGSITL